MKAIIISMALASSLLAAELGTFISIDEKTGEKTAKWQISEQNGELIGKITKLYGYDDDKICEKCSKTYKGFSYAPDASKMKLVGAPLLYGLKKTAEGEYKNGYIIDPKSGSQYRANAKISGDKLTLRGYIGVALLGRTQVWQREK